MADYVWSIDDAGLGGDAMVESLLRASRFFASRGVGATWFTVPKGQDQPLSARWREALATARGLGGDIQLHGLTHADCFEFGPPAWPATTILPTLRRDYDRQRASLVTRYTLDSLRARLEEGMAIFDRELGVVPTVFRAPCGAISQPMFAALRAVGLRYHSCMYISGAGYSHLAHNGGAIAPKWVDSIPHQPFRWYHDVVEIPILNEYTWRGSGAHSQAFIKLAQQDLDRIRDRSAVVVILMHTHGIADDYAHAFRLADAVMDHVGRQPGTRFSTLGELAASGRLTEAATVTGPDTLTL